MLKYDHRSAEACRLLQIPFSNANGPITNTNTSTGRSIPWEQASTFFQYSSWARNSSESIHIYRAPQKNTARL